MPFAAPLLTARTLVLAKPETVVNQDSNPTAALDAFLVSEADVRVDPTVLERNNFRSSISPTSISIGRKLVTATFTHELKASGTIGVISKLGVLLRGCGFSQTIIANTAAAVIPAPVLGSANGGTIVVDSEDTVPTSRFGRYTLRVTTPGADNTGKLQVTGDPLFEGDATILRNLNYTSVAPAGRTLAWNITDLAIPVMTVSGGPWSAGEVAEIEAGGVTFKYTAIAADTDTIVATALKDAMIADPRFVGTANAIGVITVAFSAAAGPITISAGGSTVTFGASVGAITVSIGTDLVLGDTFQFDLLRPGVHYSPISTGFETMTLHIFFDGLLHKITGSMGTVSFNGAAGQFGTAQFTFTGQYIEPTDVPLPTGSVFESTRPKQVELARLVFDDFRDPCAESFSFDMANEVTPRDCINTGDGFNGVSITGRNPAGGANPEATLGSIHNFWRRFADATQQQFHVQVGTAPGNIVHIESPSLQYSNVTYTDRNGNRAYDLTLRLSADTDDGDDEIKIVFA